MDMFNLLLRFLENSTIWQILILLKKFTVFFCFFRMIFRCFLPFLGVCQSLLRPIDLSQFDWRKIKIVNVRKHRFSFSRWHFKTFFFPFHFCSSDFFLILRENVDHFKDFYRTRRFIERPKMSNQRFQKWNWLKNLKQTTA